MVEVPHSESQLVDAVVISHHLIERQSRVPELEIQRGLLHRARVLASPETSLQENPDGY